MRDGLRDKAGKIFDGSVFNTMFDNQDSTTITIYKKPPGNPSLIPRMDPPAKERIWDRISKTDEGS